MRHAIRNQKTSRRVMPRVESAEARVLLSEFGVNSETTGDQDAAAVARDADGDSVVVWQGPGADGTGSDIYARLYDAAGAPRGDAFRVNRVTDNAQGAPSVAMDAAGNFVVAWEGVDQAGGFGTDPAGSSYDIYARRFDAAGVPIAVDFPVNADVAGRERFPSVAMAPSGEFLIAWQTFDSRTDPGADIMARRFDALGRPIGSPAEATPFREFRVNEDAAGYSGVSHVSAAIDARGRFVIAWQGAGAGSNGLDIFARSFDEAGAASGTTFVVNTARDGDQGVASAARNAQGETVIAWSGPDGSGNGIFARRFPLGGPAGAEFRVNAETAGEQLAKAATIDDRGDVVVAYSGPDAGGSGIFRRAFPKVGAPGAETPVNTTVAGDQASPDAAVTPDGDLLITWTGPDGSGTGIFADTFAGSARTAPPRVAGVEAGTWRERVISGATIHRSDIDRLVVTVSEDLSDSARDPANWTLSRNHQPIAGGIAGVAFGLNPETLAYEVTLQFPRPLGAGAYVLGATAAIADRDGVALDGDRDGLAGGAFALAFAVDPLTVGPTTLASALMSDGQGYAVARDALGNFVMVRAVDGADGSGFGVVGRRFSAAWVPLGPEFPVNTYTAGDQGLGTLPEGGRAGGPQVAMNDAGSFVITWVSNGQDGSGLGVFARRFGPDGAALGPEFQVNPATMSAGPQANPTIAIDANGAFVVAYQAYDADIYGVYVRRYGADGTLLGAGFRANINQANWQAGPSLALAPGGVIVVAWSSLEQDGSGNGVYLRRFGPGGPLDAGDVRVNSTTDDVQANPHLAINDAGDLLVVWHSFGQDGSNLGIYAQRFNPAFARVGGEFRVNERRNDAQSNPSATMAPDGSFVVAWTSLRQDGSDLGAYARRYLATGAPDVHGEFRINAPTRGLQAGPVPMLDGDGNLAVFWGTRGNEAYFQRFAFAPGDTLTPPAGLRVEPIAGPVSTTEAGVAVRFSVRLASAPTSSVTVPVASSNLGEGRPDVSALLFTPDNWNVRQTVAILGQDDDIDDDNVAYSITFGPATSDDPAYAGLTRSPVALNNIDEDTAGFLVTPTSPATTSESGESATFTVRLTSEPRFPVTVAITSTRPDEGRPDAAELTFDKSNWSTVRTVTVTGQDDPAAEGNVSYRVELTATSADPNYQRTHPGVSLVNRDDDTPGFTVAPITEAITDESGRAAGFSVRLNTRPTANVVIPIASGDPGEGTVSVASLTFTPDNWEDDQSFSVTGRPDDVDDDDQGYTITVGQPTGADANYAALPAQTFTLTNLDIDTAGILVTPTSITTGEGGPAATFQVRLASRPTADVTIGLATSNAAGGTAGAPALTFTSENWSAEQTVSVTGADNDFVNVPILYAILTAPATSADVKYAGLDALNVSTVNSDNDVAGVLVTGATGGLTTEAGGTASFSVRLTSRPSARVTIALTSSDPTEGQPRVASLSFEPNNWDRPQAVVVAGVDDAADDGDLPYAIELGPIESADLDYSPLEDLPPVTLTNRDNDAAGIVVTPTSITTGERGPGASFAVRLASQPSASVTIGLSSSDLGEGVVSVASLSFSPETWSTPQQVTVSGVDDSVVDGDRGYVLITAPATSADADYAGLDALDVSAINRDDDLVPPPPPPVTVVGARLVTRRVGRRLAKAVVVTFSGDLDATAAAAVGNYTLTSAGRDRKLGTKDDKRTRLVRAAYDQAARAVTLSPARGVIAARPRPQLRVLAGVLDALRRPIDGDRDGLPGGDWTGTV